MKKTNYLILILTAGILAVAGCGKSGSSTPPPVGMVDFGALQAAFPTPTPEVSTCLQKLRMTTRYRQYDAALVELDKLSQLPDLNEAQKKVVNNAIEQVKVAVSKMPPAPSQ